MYMIYIFIHTFIPIQICTYTVYVYMYTSTSTMYISHQMLSFLHSLHASLSLCLPVSLYDHTKSHNVNVGTMRNHQGGRPTSTFLQDQPATAKKLRSNMEHSV